MRELRNAIERAMILEDTAYIRPASLHIEVRASGSALVSLSEAGSHSFAGDRLSLPEHERHMVMQALDSAAWNQTQAARLLKITRDTLLYKMKKFKLL